MSADEQSFADAGIECQVMSSTERFHGHVWNVQTDIVRLVHGQQVERDFLAHPGAVGIVAVDEELRVLLVQQYRHPVSAMLWEPPAGLLDVTAEDPLDAAARELYEEGGYRAHDWAVLVDAFSSPGGSTESVRIYLARGLTAVDDHERHIGEHEEHEMVTRWVPLSEARAAVLSGRLHNPLGVMGILAAASVLLDGVAGLRPVESDWFRSGIPASSR
jgi:8-oxo-dGTP pyrophosphatase MutT (NUDIX family)